MSDSIKDPNPFEDCVVAEEWIAAVESEKEGSRDKEIYPLLYSWTHELQPKTVIEIGSGQGICSSKLDLSSGEYIGIEPSPTLNDRAREMHKEPNKKFIEGDAYDVPLPDSSADAAFSVGVWFHVADVEKAHEEMRRILKPGGELMIVTANAKMISVWQSFFNNPKKDGKRLEGQMRASSRLLSFNILYIHPEEEIIESLVKNSFSIASVQKLGFGKNNHRDEGIWIAIRAVKK